MLLSRKKFLQQTGLACASAMFPFSKLVAHVPPRKKFALDTWHPKNCTQNLVDNPFYELDSIEEADFTYYKDTGPTAKDILYKLEEKVTGCVDTTGLPQKVCDVTNNHKDEDISVLRYRAYYPRSAYSGEDPDNGHDYETVPLPLVVLFHPGGFQECIGYTPPGIRIVCQQLARRGFVCITADYRAGRVKDPSVSPTKVSVQQQIAPYRGIQDGHGAIRSIFKRNGEVGRGGHNFKINPNQFFIGGQSAGAVVALGIAYYRNQAMINQVFPADTGSLSIQQALGHINADYYYGEPGTDLDNPLYTPRIRGVLNCWGGITIPKAYDENTTYPNPDLGKVEKGFFEAVGSEDANKINPSMIAFVGAEDDVIPMPDDPLEQDVINSSATPLKTENFCFENTGNYILKPSGSGPNYNVYVKMGSAQNMYYILKELDRFTELYVDCDMTHGIKHYNIDNFDVNTLGATSPDLVFNYIAERAAVFFQTCMNVSPYTNYPPFNYRGKSLFISTDYDTNINVINHRICADYCTGTPLGATCSTGIDTPCD